MATRETAGAVVVMIDGDASPLLAKYAQAESASRAAGTRIATALGSGFQSSTGLVDQFGRSVQTNAIAPLTAAAPVAERTAVAFQAVGRAAGGSVTQIQASSAALRTLEGGTQGSIRAAERFISIIPGVGAALQIAFPLIGLIAFAEIIARIAEKFAGLSDAEKQAEQSNKQFSDSIAELKTRLDSLNLEEFTQIYGKIAGAFEKASNVVTRDVSADVRNIALLKAQIADVQAHGAEAQSPGQAVKRAAIQELVPFGADINRSSGEAAQKQKLIELTQQLDAAEVKLAVDRKQGSVDALSAMKDLSDQDDKNAAEKARAAEEAARAAQEAAREQAAAQKQRMEEIARASKEFYSELNRQAREAAAEQKRAGEEMSRGLLEGLREGLPEAEAAMTDFFRDLDEQRKESQRTTQEGIKTSSERIQVSDETEKVQLQVAYASQLVHSRQQELAYAQAIAAIDIQSARDKVESLEALKSYQESQGLTAEAAKTELEIEKEKLALLKAQGEAAKQITAVKGGVNPFGNLAGDISNAPFQLAGALANGIVGGKKGEDIGQQIRSALKGIGKEMMGDVFKDLISATAGNTLATLGNTFATEINTLWLQIKSILGFASGGRPPVGIPSIVGERGPELFVPDVPGVILPSVPTSGAYGIGTSQITSTIATNSASQTISIGAINLHNVRDMQDVARRLPDVLKARSPVFSPASR